ncbi:uncharacterized protein LOC135398179 [Ornithodoros turicata]|uniref:uncharacterized protein LOC135398179 n=1 Tax=Ornithodoros turicata TaxID=34597 RepID=UPI003138FB68
MKVAPLLCCFLLVCGKHILTKVQEANQYMDKLLHYTLQQSGSISNVAHLDGFRIKFVRESQEDIGHAWQNAVSRAPFYYTLVRRDVRPRDTGHLLSLTHRFSPRRHGHKVTKRLVISIIKPSLENDFELNLQGGKMTGFHWIRRLGDCSPPFWQLGNVTLSCYLSLDGVRADYNGTTFGELSSLGHVEDLQHENISVRANLKGWRVFVEVTSLPRLSSWTLSSTQAQPPRLSSWSVTGHELHITYSRAINIDSDRAMTLHRKVDTDIRQIVTEFLYSPMQYGFRSAVQMTTLPLP